MKFLCTKVKESWLTSPQNRAKVIHLGLIIKDPYIGIEIKNEEPTKIENNAVYNAVNDLFSSHIQAFPIRLIEL